MKDSFIFYRSFYESAKELNQKDRLKFYDAVCELALNQKETDMSGVAKAVFIAIKPQIEANNKRYANGCKPKKNKKEAKDKQNGSKAEANENENVNDNVNENDNDNVNVNENVFGLFETEFKRPLSSSELMKLSDLIERYGEDKTTLALRSALLQDVRDFKYIERILQNDEEY